MNPLDLGLDNTARIADDELLQWGSPQDKPASRKPKFVSAETTDDLVINLEGDNRFGGSMDGI